MGWSRSWKIFIITFNSFLLAFEPVAWSLSKDAQTSVKEFLESSGLSKRDVSAKEILSKYEKDMLPEVAAIFREAIAIDPEVVLPKMVATKVKAENGEEDIQIQYSNGKSTEVMTLIGRGDAVIRFPSSNETWNVGDIAEPKKNLGKNRNKEQSFAKELKLPFVMGFDEYKSMTKNDQIEYFRKIKELAVIEDQIAQGIVEKADSNNKASTGSSYSMFNPLFMKAFFGELACATEQDDAAAVANGLRTGNTCIYAGRVADMGCKKKPVKANGKCDYRNGDGFQCGGLGSEFRKQMDGDLKCQLKDSSEPGVKCFEALYGDVCVKRDNNATKNCFTESKLNICEKKKEWEKAGKSVEQIAPEQYAFCAKVLKKGSKEWKSSIMDMKETCRALAKGIKDIKNFNCDKPNPPPVVPPTGGGQPPPPPVKPQPPDPRCDDTAAPVVPAPVTTATDADCPNFISPKSNHKPSECSNGGSVVTCQKSKDYWYCQCPSGQLPFVAESGVAYDCAKANSGSSSSSSSSGSGSHTHADSSQSTFWKDWGKPLGIALGALVLGVFVVKWMKSSLGNYYNSISSSTAATPVPSTSTIYRGTR